MSNLAGLRGEGSTSVPLFRQFQQRSVTALSYNEGELLKPRFSAERASFPSRDGHLHPLE